MSQRDVLSSDTKKYLETHMGETDLSKIEGINTIKNWLKENPKFHACAEDAAILPFLRNCKYDLDKTKNKIKKHYTMRTKIPEWFANRDPTLANMQELLDLGVFVPLKKFVDNKLVFIVRMRAYDPKKYLFEDVVKLGKIFLDVIAHQDERVAIFGVITIFDINDITFSHVSPITFSVMKNITQMFMNDCWSPKNMVFLNTPFFVHAIVNLFRAFLSGKLRKRIQICGDYESLHDCVDKEILPPEYGGCGDDVDCLIKFWKNNVTSHKDWLKEDEKYKADL